MSWKVLCTCRRFMLFIFAGVLSALTILPIDSSAQSVATLYTFSGQNGMANPQFVIPAQGRDGSMFGTTFGSSGSSGAIFRLRADGKGASIYSFGAGAKNPGGGLTLGSDGNLYGTASAGGANGVGVLFKTSPSGEYTVLHDFAGGTDGANPNAPPILASDGNLYGTTVGQDGASTVYRYTREGTFSTIYSFDQAHGQSVYSSLLEGIDASLYGTAERGGASDCGTLFRLSKAGKVLWSYSFPCGPGGAYPIGPLVLGNDGNYYGTTESGGNELGFGTIFKVDSNGSVSILYTLRDLRDGGNPLFGLVQGSDGNLYGTNSGGGQFSEGNLFQITLAGNYKVLYSFNEKSGTFPYAPPFQNTNGKFYGTTNTGGKANLGTVYSLDMGLAAFVTFVRPTGKMGQAAQILGQGLTGATAVTFNGVPTTNFSVVSDTYMTAVIPTTATSGPVVVTTPTGTLTSNVNFRISQ